MKVRKRNIETKANKIFTDREEPRAAFWKNYNLMKENMQDEADVRVLTYYGIGGIGKTSLLKQIIEEIDSNVKEPLYAYYDFNVNQNSRTTLLSLRNQLSEKYDFEFPLFDVGNYIYSKKMGEKVESIDEKSVMENSPILRLLVNTVAIVPYISIISQIINLADSGANIAKKFVKKHEIELKEIEYKDVNALYNHLPFLFAKDLSDNISKCNDPLVILLDTYEQLVNEMSSMGEPYSNDMWLRGPDGLIQNTPNVLWVIAGREKLRWVRFDKEWEDSLEQHLLGSLSFNDSSSFLKGAGVEDDNLIRGLIELTEGTPVYLDLCVDTYYELISRNIKPDISDFGNNVYALIERFAKYMDDGKKEMTYFLSCLKTWDDETAISLGKDVVPNFSIVAYEKVKELSFVEFYNNQYSMHDVIAKVFYDNCPIYLKNMVIKNLIDNYIKKFNADNVYSVEFANLFVNVMELSMEYYKEPQDFHDFYIKRVHNIFLKLMDSGVKAGDYVITKIDKIKGDKENILLPLYNMELVYTALMHSDITMAIVCAENAVELYQEMCGEKSKNTIYALEALAKAYKVNDDVFKTNSLYKKIYDLKREIWGDNHIETLIGFNNYVGSLFITLEEDQAIPLYEEFLEKNPVVMKENKPICVDILANYAIALSNAYKHQEALDILEKCFDKCNIIYGVNHLRTVQINELTANEYYNLGRKFSAKKLQENVYEMKKAILSSNHYETALSLDRLALYREQDYLFTPYYAIDERKESIKILENVYGKNNHKIVMMLDHLADSLEKAKRYEELISVREEVIIRESQSESPRLLDYLQKLAEAYEKVNDYNKALYYYNKTNEYLFNLNEEYSFLNQIVSIRIGNILFYQTKFKEALGYYIGAYNFQGTGKSLIDLETYIDMLENMKICFEDLNENDKAQRMSLELEELKAMRQKN